MGMMIIRHKVRDYGQWRPIFDGHVEMQRAVGLINPRVYHSADSWSGFSVAAIKTGHCQIQKGPLRVKRIKTGQRRPIPSCRPWAESAVAAA